MSRILDTPIKIVKQIKQTGKWSCSCFTKNNGWIGLIDIECKGYKHGQRIWLATVNIFRNDTIKELCFPTLKEAKTWAFKITKESLTNY